MANECLGEKNFPTISRPCGDHNHRQRVPAADIVEKGREGRTRLQKPVGDPGCFPIYFRNDSRDGIGDASSTRQRCNNKPPNANITNLLESCHNNSGSGRTYHSISNRNISGSSNNNNRQCTLSRSHARSRNPPRALLRGPRQKPFSLLPSGSLS